MGFATLAFVRLCAVLGQETRASVMTPPLPDDGPLSSWIIDTFVEYQASSVNPFMGGNVAVGPLFETSKRRFG